LYQKFLPTVTLTEVNSLIAQWIKPTDRSVVIMAPEKEKNTLPAQSAVMAQLNKPVGN
jgi:zinc protease